MLSTICEHDEQSNIKTPVGSLMANDDRNDPFGITWTDPMILDKTFPVTNSSLTQCDEQSKFYNNKSPLKTEEVPLVMKNSRSVATTDILKASAGFLSRLSTRRIRRNRLVQKNGEYNISLANVPKQKLKFFTDIFTTMIEMKWRYLLIVFTCSFLSSWLLFAGVYYGVMMWHGDFDDPMLLDENWIPCVSNVKNFVSIFLFSLETQHTIGYGSRYPSEKCPAIVVTLCVQSIFGLMIQTLLAGVVFAKLARPQKRAATLLFSKQACISMRDGKLCMLLRVGDMRKSHLAEAHIRLQMISKRITNEGELLPFHQYEMNVGFESGLDRIFVVWPITICHVIDEDSPLYAYSAEDLASARFEVVAILEGVVQSGATMQARTSYLPSEILWGYRFEKLITYQRDNGKYRIDFSKFHKVYAIDTPTLSAKEIDVMRDAGLNVDEVFSCEDPQQAENGGETPYDSLSKSESVDRPSIVDIVTVENREESTETFNETENLLPSDYKYSRRVSGSPDRAQDIIRRHRKMSTMSQKLERLLPQMVANNASSNKSINSKSDSMNNVSKDRRRSVLREHDIM